MQVCFFPCPRSTYSSLLQEHLSFFPLKSQNNSQLGMCWPHLFGFRSHRSCYYRVPPELTHPTFLSYSWLVVNGKTLLLTYRSFWFEPGCLLGFRNMTFNPRDLAMLRPLVSRKNLQAKPYPCTMLHKQMLTLYSMQDAGSWKIVLQK